MDKLIDRIEQHWLEWESVPFAFAILMAFFVWLASEVNDWVGLTFEGTDYLLLAIPFFLGFVVYMICCAVHNYKEEKARAAAADVAEEAPPAKKRAWMIIGIALSVITVVFAVIVFIGQAGMKSGDYVVWSQRYNVSLTPEVVNDYYLAGDAVEAKGNGLAHYSERSVVKLEFNKDESFYIYVNGEKLGTVPGKNGVGTRAECTSNLWVLEEAGDGVYYVKNVTDQTYLKWFVAKDNWTSHPNITEDNKDQYLICLTKIK